MIKVLIADDVELFREGLKKIIEQDCEIKVIACAIDGKEAVKFCDLLRPDVMLMDIRMPQLNGFEAAKLIREKNRVVAILFLTTFYEEDHISNEDKSIADGYVFKDMDQEELTAAIKEAFYRKSAEIKASASEQDLVHEGVSEIGNTSIIDFNLSENQLMLIKLVVEGKKDKEISRFLGIREREVKSMVLKILKKFGLETRLQLANFAIKNDLV
ncbi:MAG: response regulator transcription factor [Clostridia bacterium]|nr:response regulator transcription factor [Clostridia bacterium]